MRRKHDYLTNIGVAGVYILIKYIETEAPEIKSNVLQLLQYVASTDT